MKWNQIQDERFTSLFHGTDRDTFNGDVAVRVALTDGVCDCCERQYWWVSIMANPMSCGLYDDEELFQKRYEAGVKYAIQNTGRAKAVETQVDSSEHGFDVRQDILRKHGFKSTRFAKHVYNGQQVEEVVYQLPALETA